MYTDINFKTKKLLKEAIANGDIVRVYQPNDMFGVTKEVNSGSHHIHLEGPHYPQPHRWYAEADTEDGVIMKVK